jgi:predicted deacylase
MTIKVGSTIVEPGTRSQVSFKVGLLPQGNDLTVTVNVVNGSKPGRVLGLLSTTHGTEFLSIEQIRRIVLGVDLQRLSGTIIAVPMANPLAFQYEMTNTPGDELNMNRYFPGKPIAEQRSGSYIGGLTESMAYVISEQLIQKSDCLLDFHLGPWGQAILCIDRPVVSGSLSSEVDQLARLTRVKIVHDWDMPAGTSVKYALSLNKPGIGIEIGGGGFGYSCEQKWLTQAEEAVRNIMKHMGMLPGEPTPPTRQVLLGGRAGLWPNNGGYHVPLVTAELLGEEVKKDQSLGYTFNPQTLDVVDEMKSPFDGLLYSIRARGPIALGEWSYLVGEKSKSKWLE